MAAVNGEFDHGKIQLPRDTIAQDVVPERRRRRDIERLADGTVVTQCQTEHLHDVLDANHVSLEGNAVRMPE